MSENLLKLGYDIKLVLLRNITDFPTEHLKDHILLLNVEKYNNKATKIFAAYANLWKFYLKYKPHRIISFSSGELRSLLVPLYVFFYPSGFN